MLSGLPHPFSGYAYFLHANPRGAAFTASTALVLSNRSHCPLLPPPKVHPFCQPFPDKPVADISNHVFGMVCADCHAISYTCPKKWGRGGGLKKVDFGHHVIFPVIQEKLFLGKRQA